MSSTQGLRVSVGATSELQTAARAQVPLSSLQFFRRAADVYADRLAAVDGGVRYSDAAFAERCLRLAAGLRGRSSSRVT